MTSKKTAIFISIGALFLVLTNVIFFRLYLQTPAGHAYTGIGFEAVADKLVYYSMIQQGAHGILFMKNVHTSEPQLGLLFSPHWYLIGMTSSLLHISIPLAYHVYRWLATIGFLMLLYAFVQKLFSKTTDQSIAFAAALFSSGLGWLYFVAHPRIGETTVHWMQHFNQTPIDLYVTEYSAFTNTLQSPLFILSYICIFLVWILFLRDKKTVRSQLLLAAIVAIFACIHPYDLPLIMIVTTAFAMTELSRGIGYLFHNLWPIGVGAVIAASYHIVSLIYEPALSGWLSQNIAFSPSLGNYLWGIGIAGPLALLGIWHLARSKELQNPYWKLVLIWAITIPVLIYFPSTINRRFANTMLIPFTLLAWYGLMQWLRSIRSFIPRMAVAMICMILAISGTLYQLAEHIFYTPTLDEKYNYYLDPYMQDAFSVLRANVGYQDVLLPSTGFIGILTAGYVPTRLYVGHAHQTVNYELKKNQMDWFFSEPQTDEALQNRKNFLAENHITAIMAYKPSMQNSIEWIDTIPGVTRIHDSIAVRIFKVAL